MPTYDVDDVATDDDVKLEIGGEDVFAELIPDDWEGTAYTGRELAYEKALTHLLNRTPPITEENLSDIAELKQVVVYGTIAHLYRVAATTPDDIHHAHYKTYAKLFSAELNALHPSISTGERGSARSVSISRR